MLLKDKIKNFYPCAISGELKHKDQLLRIISDNNNELIFDLTKTLPTHYEIWVTFDKKILDTLSNQQMIEQISGKNFILKANSIESLKLSLKSKALSLLGFCNKAGMVICGYQKIEQAFKNKKIKYIFCSSEAKRSFKSFNNQVIIIESKFDNSQISSILGREEIAYIGLKDSSISTKFIESYHIYQNLE